MKSVLVHDWLTTYAGAERVLEAMLELDALSNAPIYTLVYEPNSFTGTRVGRSEVVTSFLQRLPGAKTRHQLYLPLMPLAVEQFDLSIYDLVISSSHAVAKGVLTRADQLHISYVHTPIRYAWDLHFQYLKDARLDVGVRGAIARTILHYIRLWDQASASRVDVFVANSRYVARRIFKVYRREAKVIYPPVDVDRFKPVERREDFYLVVSRAVPYKKLNMIVDAFNTLGLPLTVIGDGPELEQLRSRAKRNIVFLGRQPDEVVVDHMQRCKAFVYAANEDFGISPVEAQAAGAPVIAFGRGGVTETVVPGETGVLFPEQTVESMIGAVREFELGKYSFDVERIRKNAERFSKERFQREFSDLLEQEWAKFAAGEVVRY